MSTHGPAMVENKQEPTPKRVSVQLGDIDGEYCSILECVCGVKYESWENSITIDAEGTTMPCCGRRLFFRAKVFCYEVAANPCICGCCDGSDCGQS